MKNQNGHKPAAYLTSVAGTPVGRLETPSTAAELVEVLALASSRRESVIPVGGATHLGIGNAPTSGDVLLSTAELKRVLAYEPADMTLSVEAGATLQSVQNVLAAHGQALPIEVASPEKATIGGILATSMYGPKRLGWGTLRDYIIGITVAYPDGTLAKAGGMVVKNVSGFDLMRMHHGALGTLGVIVSANFKVLPFPRSERTVTATAVDTEQLVAIRQAAMRWRGRPAAFEVVSHGDTATVSIRIDGRERTADLLATELADRIPCPSSILDPKTSQGFWSRHVSGFDASEAASHWWIRCRLLPDQTLEALARVDAALSGIGVEDVVLTASPGLGFVDIRGSRGDALAPALDRVRQLSSRASVVTTGPAARQGIEAWGADIEAIELMTKLKREFDPGSVLNPGRYVGGL